MQWSGVDLRRLQLACATYGGPIGASAAARAPHSEHDPTASGTALRRDEGLLVKAEAHGYTARPDINIFSASGHHLSTIPVRGCPHAGVDSVRPNAKCPCSGAVIGVWSAWAGRTPSSSSWFS